MSLSTLVIPQVVSTGPDIPPLPPAVCDDKCHWYLLIRVVPTTQDVGYYYWLERTTTEQPFPPQYVEGFASPGAQNNGCNAAWLSRVQQAANAYVPRPNEEVVEWQWQPGGRTIGPPGCGLTGTCVQGPEVDACRPIDQPGSLDCPNGEIYDTLSESCKLIQIPSQPFSLCLGAPNFAGVPICYVTPKLPPLAPPTFCKPPGMPILLSNGAIVCQFDPPTPNHLPTITPFGSVKPVSVGMARPERSDSNRTVTPAYLPNSVVHRYLNPTLRRGIPFVMKACACGDQDLDEEFYA